MPEDRPCKFEVVLKGNLASSNESIIKRIIGKRTELRKIFISIAITEPSLSFEIREQLGQNITRSFFRHLKTLASFGLIKRVPVFSLLNKDELNEIEKKALKKYAKWTENMTNAQKDYFLSKTGYYVITAQGEEFIEWAVSNQEEVYIKGIPKKKKLESIELNS